jgi:hypothetical protein
MQTSPEMHQLHYLEQDKTREFSLGTKQVSIFITSCFVDDDDEEEDDDNVDDNILHKLQALKTQFIFYFIA